MHLGRILEDSEYFEALDECFKELILELPTFTWGNADEKLRDRTIDEIMEMFVEEDDKPSIKEDLIEIKDDLGMEERYFYENHTPNLEEYIYWRTRHDDDFESLHYEIAVELGIVEPDEYWGYMH